MKPPAYQSDPDATAWRSSAPALARFAMERMVNRTDVRVGYLPLSYRAYRVRADGVRVCTRKSVTKPRLSQCGLEFLTEGTLTRHFTGKSVGDLVGLHAISPVNSCRWAAIELDCHAGQDGDPTANWIGALYWSDVLTALGFSPVLSDSNGAGGYHLLVLFDRPAPSETIYRFLQWLIQVYQEHGLKAAPETFPRQPSLVGLEFGNALRLPGRHHTAAHWSKFWDGERWLAGRFAVQHFLSTKPSSPDLLPETPKPPPPTPRPPVRTGPGLMSPAQIACKALAGIPNCDLHYNDWMRVGAALHSADASLLSEWIAWTPRATSMSGESASGHGAGLKPTAAAGSLSERWCACLDRTGTTCFPSPNPNLFPPPAMPRRW